MLFTGMAVVAASAVVGLTMAADGCGGGGRQFRLRRSMISAAVLAAGGSGVGGGRWQSSAHLRQLVIAASAVRCGSCRLAHVS